MGRAVDVAAWLRNLGLERYEPAFRESEIDFEVLPELTESDLETLGLPLGPRRKLLKAIRELDDHPLLADPDPRRQQADRRKPSDVS